MNKTLLNEVLECLPKDRTLFRYGRDDYALMLLSRAVGNGRSAAELRKSGYGQLLVKPCVKRLMAVSGNGILSRDLFDYAYSEDRFDFLLTVGRWNEGSKRYQQTSRRSGNLVLRLNFNAGHDREFRRVIGKAFQDYFVAWSHPVLREGERDYFRNTMAWVRMDLDFETGEVLIEEVQTDWLRGARRYLRNLEWCARRKAKRLDSMVVNGKVDAAMSYVKNTLTPYFRVWDEAALTAAINFIVDELGMARIFYHSFETGNALKNIRYGLPPRSLYTDLPRKFCFEETDETPEMLYRSPVAKRVLKKISSPRWYRMEIQRINDDTGKR